MRAFHFAAPSLFALLGGAKTAVLQLPTVGQALAFSEIDRLAERLGYAGASRDRVVADVARFDDEWLKFEWAATAKAVDALNRR